MGYYIFVDETPLEVFMRRKLLTLAFSTMAGVVAFNMNKAVAMALLAALIVFFVHYISKDYKNTALKYMCIFSIVAYCAGGMLITTENNSYQSGRYLDGGRAKVLNLKVLRVDRYDADKFRFRCRITGVNGKSLTHNQDQRVLISYYGKLTSYWKLTGRTIEAYGVMEAPKTAGNPRTFDYSRYLKTLKISHVSTVNRFKTVETEAGIIDKVIPVILGIRERFTAGLDCGDDQKAILKGVLFGDINMMDEDIYEDFQANGTAHVLAVSGLHVGVIYGIYRALTKKKKSLAAALLFIGFLCLYGTLTLWSVSVTRAIALIIIITLGDALDRSYDLLTALGAVVIGVVICNPWVIFGASFQMSFLAVTSISFLQPFLQKHMPPGISAMVAVQLGMMPYIAYMFNYVPLMSFICNIPVIYLLSIIVPAGIAGIMIFAFFGSCGPYETVLGSMADLFIDINSMLSQNGAFAVSVVSPPLWLVTALYIFSFYGVSEAFTVYYKRKRYGLLIKISLAFLSIVIIVAASAGTPFDKADMIMVDVGQGDCLHIKAGDHRDVLVDGGGNIDYDVGKKVLKPYLLKNRCRDIDLALATHLHTDHYLGLKQLVRVFDVKKRITRGQAGDVIAVSDICSIRLLWPADSSLKTDDENLNSLIFKIKVKDMTILVTGDITEAGEKALIEHYRGTDILKCDILKVAHHGSKYSTCREFIEAVAPSVAVIGVGKNNYGHPSKDVIEKLRQKGIMVYRTDFNGAVGFTSREGKIDICVQRE